MEATKYFLGTRNPLAARELIVIGEQNARQLAEFAARAVRRVPDGEERLKYDHLFGAGDPENKAFWVGMHRDAADLVGRYVEVSA